MSNGGVLGRRNVPGVDGFSGVWSMREIADARRAGVWISWDGVDLFDTDTTAQYTKHGEPSVTWAVAAGELTVSGSGGISAFIRNGTSYTDTSVEADINQADDSGLVLRFIDINNYYNLTLFDDSGGAPSENLRIVRVSGGTETKLKTANFAWTRGVSKTIRFQVSGATLTGFVDGVQTIQTTDSTHAGPGGVGMRAWGGATWDSKFQAFRWGLR